MSSLTPRARLVRPTLADPFITNDVASNWDKIDAAPGEYICTSNTRPDWGPQNEGQSISETDTGFSWKWIGGEFVRRAGVGNGGGLLTTTSGSLAVNQKIVNITTSATVYTPVITLTGVIVPSGKRTLKITASYSSTVATAPRAYHVYATYQWYVAILRSAYGNTGPIEREWCLHGSPGDSGQSLVAYIPNGLPSGVYDWSLQIRAFVPGTTASIYSNSSSLDSYDNFNDTPSLAFGPQIFVEEI